MRLFDVDDYPGFRETSAPELYSAYLAAFPWISFMKVKASERIERKLFEATGRLLGGLFKTKEVVSRKAGFATPFYYLTCHVFLAA